MGSYLKSLKLTIQTVSPVYIGNGKTTGKREYLFVKGEAGKKSKIQFFDVNKMYKGMCQLHKKDIYEEYLLGNRESELSYFLQHQHISGETCKPWILRECVVGDSSLDTHSVKDICEFIKGPDGRPYIPGSSFKEMLRTILETVFCLRNQDEIKNTAVRIESEPPARRNVYQKGNDEELGQSAFHRDLFPDKDGKSIPKDIKNDTLRGFIVGDSDPIEWKNMCICQKEDMTVQGEFKKLNVLRECIKPGVKIVIPITVDTRICDLDHEKLYDAVKKYYQNYKQFFVDKFTGAPEIRGNSTTMFLGGGAGYPSKTVTYGLYEDKETARIVSRIINETLPQPTDRSNIRKQHGHDKDVQKGVSPHMLKCTTYNDKYYQMGACCIVGCKYKEVE